MPAKVDAQKKYTKKQLTTYLKEIESNVLENQGDHLHSLLALNEILRNPTVAKHFDDNLKTKAKGIWNSIKSNGFQLEDPPMLFGSPENPSAEDVKN